MGFYLSKINGKTQPGLVAVDEDSREVLAKLGDGEVRL